MSEREAMPLPAGTDGRPAAAPDAAETGRRIVRQLVKKDDRDRYWSALFAPEPAQSHLLALYAFNIELSRICEQVQEAMAGQIRLQWWRDAIELSIGGRSGHPVADQLAKARIVCNLPDDLFMGMIDARVFDLGREPMADMPALETYLMRTAGAVFLLACQILGVPAGLAGEAARQAALAYGLAGLLRALPYHAARGRIFLPAAHLSAHGVAAHSLIEGQETPQLARALQALRETARRHLAAFRTAAAELPPQGLPAFLPLALIEPYFAKMARPKHRPLRHLAGINPALRFWLILRAHLRSQI